MEKVHYFGGWVEGTKSLCCRWQPYRTGGGSRCIKFLDTRSSRISDFRLRLLSDLIHGITENGHRHASGPVEPRTSLTHIPLVSFLHYINITLHTFTNPILVKDPHCDNTYFDIYTIELKISFFSNPFQESWLFIVTLMLAAVSYFMSMGIYSWPAWCLEVKNRFGYRFYKVGSYLLG